MSSEKSQKKDNYFFHNFVRLTGVIPAYLWLRPKVLRFGNEDGSKIKGGVMFISNHVTFIDPMMLHLILWRRRLHCLATKDLYRTKLMSWFLNATLSVQVDKENFSMRSLHAVTDRLKEGKALLIFPEGTVNETKEEMLQFKTGALLMAHLGNAPIVPVYLQRREKFIHRTYAVIGEPINVRELCGPVPSMDKLQEACALVESKTNELKEYLDNYKKGK